jgi:uncharacterized membrane protein
LVEDDPELPEEFVWLLILLVIVVFVVVVVVTFGISPFD